MHIPSDYKVEKKLVEDTVDLSKKLCQGRTAMALEGGYDLPSLSETVGSIAAMGMNDKPAFRFTDIEDSECFGRETLDMVKDVQSSYWSL